MKQLVKTKVIRITETQFLTLQKMKYYNINVGNFIRDAISEKIKKEYKNIVPSPKKINYPF